MSVGTKLAGVTLCWTASLFNSYGTTLFKYQEMVKPEQTSSDEDSVGDDVQLGNLALRTVQLSLDNEEKSEHDTSNYDLQALCSFVIGGILDGISISLLPISVWSANCVVSIPMGQILAWKILKQRINKKTWILISLITACAVGVSIFGAASGGKSSQIINTFTTTIDNPGPLCLLLFSSLLYTACAAYLKYQKNFIRRASKIPEPWELYNLCGPVAVGLAGAYQNVTTKLVLEYAIVIFFGKTQRKSISYYLFIIVLILLPIFLIIQLKTIKFMMAHLHIVTAAPTGQCCLIAFSSIAGIVFFRETPVSTFGYVSSVLLMLTFIGMMVYVNTERNTQLASKQNLRMVAQISNHFDLSQISSTISSIPLSLSSQSTIISRQTSGSIIKPINDINTKDNFFTQHSMDNIYLGSASQVNTTTNKKKEKNKKMGFRTQTNKVKNEKDTQNLLSPKRNRSPNQKRRKDQTMLSPL